LLFVAVVLMLLFFNRFFSYKVTNEALHKASDQLSAILHQNLEQEKSSALRLALVLSQNSDLAEALENDDEDRGYELLSRTMRTIHEHTKVMVRSQIISADLTIFARSWDNSFAGMPLDMYRPDLNYFERNKQPRAAIEVGRRLGFKATVPIYKKSQLLGFVEVLQFFESPTLYFRNAGIDLYVLMEERFQNIAILMQENPKVGGYVVANLAHNPLHMPMLSHINLKALFQKRVMAYDEHYLFMYPMKNGEQETIGAFVMVLSREAFERFIQEEGLSFLIDATKKDLVAMIKEEEMDDTLFKSRYDKTLMFVKESVAKEDRELFMQEAYEKLNEYSKEELISILLHYNFNRRIQGAIE